MNRRQRAKKLKKRKHHRDEFQGMTKMSEQPDGSSIEVARGRSTRVGLHRRERPVSKIEQFYIDVGVQLDPKQLRQLQALAGQRGNSEEQVIEKIRAGILRLSNDRAAQRRIRARNNELAQLAETVIETKARLPSEAEWEDITSAAKRRKRGVKSFAEKAGFALTGSDPKQRESWTRS
jgi:hypothetical protein